jgi:hypothetical protein
LAFFAPALSAARVLASDLIEGETEEFNPRNDLFERPAKSHLHGSWILIVFSEVVVVNLVRVDAFSIIRLKKHTVVEPT